MSTRAARLGLLCAAALAIARPGRADNPLNSSEKPATPAVTTKPEEAHNDTTVVPVVGGSSDIGVGGVFFAGLTRIRKGYDPFVWDIQAAGFVSFGVQHGSFALPYVDVYSKLTVTRFLGVPLQLEVRPSFTDELTLYYYGMGNASSATFSAFRSSSKSAPRSPTSSRSITTEWGMRRRPLRRSVRRRRTSNMRASTPSSLPI